MSSEKLLDLMVGKGLEGGIFPSAEPTAGVVWNSSLDVWFRDLSIEQTLGRVKKLDLIWRPARFLTQAFNNPNKTLYYENAGAVYGVNATGNPSVFSAPYFIGALDVNGDYWLEPWGNWLAMTDGITQPVLWQGAGAPIPIGVGQFKTVRIFRKIAQFLVAYGLGGTPDGDAQNGFAWCDVNDPTNWTPAVPPNFASAARNLIIRDLDSEIVCVTELGGAHAVYSRNYMILVQYVGPGGGWLGTPTQALVGIGAVSKRSVVSVGPYNFGLSRGGVFATDGSTFSWIDRPAVDAWLQANIDFAQASSIWGYWDTRLQLVVWVLPLLSSSLFYSPSSPRIRLSMDPKTRTVTPESIYLSRKVFGFLDGVPYGGMEQEVFEQTISVLQDGIYFESVPGTVNGSFSLVSQLFDAGDTSIYKLWDFLELIGTIDKSDSTMQISFGYSDEPRLDTINFDPPQPLAFLNFPAQGPRESVYFAFKISGSSNFKITSIKVHGEKAGYVS